jgi:purine-binding chemotaxis protein CheW
VPPHNPAINTVVTTGKWSSALGGIAHWVVFGLDQNRYALPLAAVDRIVRAAQITPLPSAPEIILGALNLAGAVLPVFNVRRRFRLPERDIEPADHFLIARTGQRTVVLVIDHAQGVLELPAAAAIDAATITPDPGHFSGVLRLEDGLVLIHNLERFLSHEEARGLDVALNRGTTSAE